MLGSAGQLGRDLVPRLDDCAALTRADADLTDPAALRQALRDSGADIVVNCAAYNFVDRAEEEPDAAFAVNAWAARDLARACQELRKPLVHFSTDYVYGLNEAGSPLTESVAPGPVSAYGLSKLAGEFAVRAECDEHLVIRTCGLYGVWGSGGKGGNFVETMLRVAGEGKPLRVVADQQCTPSYTADVAEAAAGLIRAGARGVVHVTNAGGTTWHDFAAEIFRQAGVAADLTPITSTEFGAKARRPAFSVLSQSGLAQWGVPAPRAWPEALAAYLAERASRKGAV